MTDLGSDDNEQGGNGAGASLLTVFWARLHKPAMLALLAILTGVAVVAQPYGSYGHLPLGVRVIYWGGIVASAIPGAILFDLVAARVFPTASHWRRVTVATLLAMGVFTPWVIFWNWVFVPYYPALDARALRIFADVSVTALSVFSLLAVFRETGAREAGPDATDTHVPDQVPEIRPLLSARLAHPDARIIRLSANDHLIEVVSECGTEQIRMRFADAVKEMAPVAGCCVHRSHWIASAAATQIQRKQGKLFVVLTNGDEIPVSRTYRPELEAARPDLF